MNLLHVVQAIAALITLASLLLLGLILIQRALSGSRDRRREEYRRRVMTRLCAYLAGEEGREPLLAQLAKERPLALELLMEQSELLGADGREKLRPIFSGLSFLQGELLRLDSKRWSSRLRAAEHLGYLGEESSVTPLKTALMDPVLDVRLAAAHSLARIGCGDAVVPIIRALDLPREISQRRIAEILALLGPKAEKPLLDILGDRSFGGSALCIAARTAGLIRLHGAVPLLEALLDHPSEEVRLNAVRTLGSLKPSPPPVDAIVRLSEDPSWEVRSAVMHTLGRLGDRGSIPTLLEGLGDPDWWVRHHAADSLLLLGTPGLEALRDASEKHPDAYARDLCREVLGRVPSTMKPAEALS